MFLTSLLVGAAAAQPVPHGMFIPTYSPKEIRSAYEMCLAVLKPEGIDGQAMKAAGWVGVRFQDSSGQEITDEPNTWAPPGSFIMVSLVTNWKTISCRVAARVDNQSEVDRLIAEWPQPLTAGPKKRSFTTWAGSHSVTVTYSGKNKPNINVLVSRKLETK